MGKKSSKARARKIQAADVVATEVMHAEEAGEGLERISWVAPELLEAHDKFVRSPAAVVESLGMRMTPSLAAQLKRVRMD